MIILPHALVGASIGATIGNLPLVFILGFLSHFILDAIPHVDQGTLHHYEKDYELNSRDYLLAGIDALITLVLIIIIIKSGLYNNYAVVVGALGGITPDLIDHVPLWKYQLKKYKFFGDFNKFHQAFSFQLAPRYWFWGVLIQLFIIGGLLFFLLV